MTKKPPAIAKARKRPSQSTMPPSGKRPGHKFIARTGLRYWYAKQVVTNTMGYPDPCIALPLDADDATIDQLCQDYTAQLKSWIDARLRDEASSAPPTTYDPRRVYDGSVRSACKVYQEHPHSKFHAIKSNSRRTYVVLLNLILRSPLAGRQIRNLSVIDVEGQYNAWRKPETFIDDDGKQWSDGRERIDRAHDGVAMLKTALRFCAALHLPSRKDPQCEQLAKELENWQFERGSAREQELTYEQVCAFIRVAMDLETRGVLPVGRGVAMAIGVAAPFDLLLRQKDVIGEHAKNQADLDKALKQGATAITWDNGDVWAGSFTWEGIAGWQWRMRTSKSKYRHVVDFDLTRRSLLFPLLERVPFAERHGAVVKGEGGGPVRERSFRKWFRQIATVAGIPTDVWHYDARAGGAGESDNLGVPLALISDGLTHSDTATTLRYIRRGRGGKQNQLADLRNAGRAANEKAK